MSEPFDDELKLALDALDEREVPPPAVGWEEALLAELAGAPDTRAVRRLRPRPRLRVLLAATLAAAAFAAFVASGAAARIGFPDPFNGPLGPKERANPNALRPITPAPSPSGTTASRPSPSASPSASPSSSPTRAPDAAPTPRPGLTASPVPLAGIADVGYSTGTWSGLVTGTTDDLSDVDVLGLSRSWIVGGGRVLSIVHGSRPAELTLTEGWLADVDFTGRRRGWVCGSSAELWATDDAGASWAKQFELGEGRLQAIAAVDRDHAWAVGDDGLHGLVVATSDGVTWSRQDVGESEVLLDVAFATPSQGVAVGYWGTLLRTTDGGLTWQSLRSKRDETLTSAWFIDADHGWVSGYRKTGYSSQAIVLSTTDGGKTWERRCLGAQGTAFADIAFADAFLGWAVVHYPKASGILETRDGGETWVLQQVVRRPLDGVDYARGRVIAVGWDGVAFQRAIDVRKLTPSPVSKRHSQRRGPSGRAAAD